MMKFHGRDRGSVRETLFTDGNGVLRSRATVRKSAELPTMSPLSERTSPRGSFDEIVIDPSSTTPATAAPAPSEGSTSQRTSDACRPNHDGSGTSRQRIFSVCSLDREPECPKTIKRACFKETMREFCYPSPDRRAKCSAVALRDQVNEVRDKMQSLSQDLQSAVRQLFLSSGIEVGHPAEFEPTPVLELEKLYESALGTKDWRSRAVELQIYGIPRAFDLLTALVGAAVHRWVFEKVHPWRGPVQEYLGSKLHRRHVDRVVAEHSKRHPIDPI
ncbi:hypothetical protein KC323_g5 [Hortaea werneckii]|nr:hypothetical protein KC323_g5 [Hortaea werneckii]